MPFFKTICLSPVSISFWRIEEREDEMLYVLPAEKGYAEAVTHFRSLRRRREWLATRCLLHLQCGEAAYISYRPSGRPLLFTPRGQEKEISVSHSSDWAALAISPQGMKVGMDIERIGERAFNLRHRFLSTEEMALAPDKEQACLMWCAKEAIYKLCDCEGLRFLEDMILHKKSGQLFAKLPTLGKIVTIHTHVEADHAVAVALFSSQ